MLERFRKAQHEPIRSLMAMKADGIELPLYGGERPSFSGHLRSNGPGAVIAEYKRASPSRGDINLGREPEEIADLYASAGASAISVLTEQEHFKGDIAYIGRMAAPGLPLLRKDFLLHPLQVRQTASTPASALLLIVRMLDDSMLRDMLQETSAHGLEAVIEIFDRVDLERARAGLAAAGSPQAIIQVNNRDLSTLAVSELPSRELIKERQQSEVWISASGVGKREQVLERASLGFDAVLVGSSLMETPDPGKALAVLTGKITEKML